MWMWYEEGVAVKSLCYQMHHSTDIVFRNDDDGIAFVLQEDLMLFNQLLPRHLLIVRAWQWLQGCPPPN